MKWPVNNPDGYATNLKEFAGSNLTLVNSSATDVYYDVVAGGGALNSTAPGVVPVGTKIANGGGQVQFFDAPRDIWVRAATQTVLDVQADAYSAKSQPIKVVAGNALVIPQAKVKTPKKFLVGALVLLFLAQIASAQLSIQGNEQQIPYSGSTAYVRNGLPVNPNLLSSGINTFILNVVPVTNSVRVYIVNDTANACANLSVSMASSGNGNLTSFNNNPSAWQSVLMTAGVQYAATTPVSLPASGTVALTSQAIIGNKIALFIVLSSGCATTSVDIQVVFGTFNAVNPNVQGVIPTGQNGVSENPLVCGGLDASNLVQPCGVYHAPGLGISSINGLAIGAPGQSIAAGYLNTTMPNGNGGPLGVMVAAPVGELNASRYLQAQLDGMYTASKNCQTLDNACAGLYTTKAGISDNENLVNAGTGTVVGGWINYVSGGGTITAYHSCRFDLNVGSVATAGGTGTVDFYVQDSGEINGTPVWTDRIHFPQIATSTTPASLHVWAALDSTNIPASCSGATCTTGVIQTYTNATLANNTIITGAPGKFLRFIYVVTGASITFAGGTGSNTFSVFCD